MKTGKTLTELATELERQVESRKDFLAMTGAISMNEKTELEGLNGSPKALNDYAHGQAATFTDIPKKYYDRMREEAPALLAANVNQWLHQDPNQKRYIRTLDGKVRGILSERFRSLDNYDLAKVTLPVLQEKGCRIVSADLTERRFYIKAILPDLCENIQEGLVLGEGHNFARQDMLIASLTLSNSEVGAGSLRVDAGFYKTRCSNLAIFDGSSLKKYHVGRAFDVDEEVRELLTDETRRQDDKAFWMKVRDVVNGAFNKDLFHERVQKMQVTAGNRIENPDVPKVIEVVRKKFAIADGLQNNILKHLIEGGDLTQWGLMNAVTRTAEDLESYDDATDLERVGGKIIELSPTEWQAIAA